MLLVAQSCPTLCDPLDYSLSGSSVHEMLQARSTQEWGAILQGVVPTQDPTQVSCIAGRFFTLSHGTPPLRNLLFCDCVLLSLACHHISEGCPASTRHHARRFPSDLAINPAHIPSSGPRCLTVKHHKLDDSSGKGGLGSLRRQGRKATFTWHLWDALPEERQRPGKQVGVSQAHIVNG